MYLNYFGLSEKPFSISPDPRFLYLSEKHRDGLAHLLYGTDETGSFVLLTGEVGTGKTTLCRRMLTQAPEDVEFALILNPLQTPRELLASICDEFNIEYRENASRKQLIDSINFWLLETHSNGDRAVVVIDEAQNLNAETLEQVRLLTNLETSSEKLLKIILIGQPELKEILNRPELRQLNQRITARYHLEPLSLAETRTYIKHRLKIAGATRSLFKPGAIKKLHRISEGVPRIMNLVSDRALTGAYGKQKEIVDARLLSNAAKEVFNRLEKPLLTSLPLIIASAVLVVGLISGLLYWKLNSSSNAGLADSDAISPATEIVEAIDTPGNNTDEAMATKEPATTQPVDRTSSKVEFLTGSQLVKLLNKEANNTAAFESLFSIWGLDFNEYAGDSACERAKKAGMQCLYSEGPFSDVLDTNLPAVLELTSRGGQLNQLTLKSRLQDQLVLQLGGNDYIIHEADLKSYWNGNYLFLWRSPPEGKNSIQPGSLGPTVVWLRRQLDLAEGVPEAHGQYQNFYNGELRERITRFQSNNGLDPDGIAGERTLIKLQTAIRHGGAEVPVLSE